MRLKLASCMILLLFIISTSAYAVNIKDVTFPIANFGRVIFNHNEHFKQNGIKNNCQICHNAIFNLRSKKNFTMADMKKGKSCGACHNPESVALNMLLLPMVKNRHLTPPPYANDSEVCPLSSGQRGI